MLGDLPCFCTFRPGSFAVSRCGLNGVHEPIQVAGSYYPSDVILSDRLRQLGRFVGHRDHGATRCHDVVHAARHGNASHPRLERDHSHVTVAKRLRALRARAIVCDSHVSKARRFRLESTAASAVADEIEAKPATDFPRRIQKDREVVGSTHVAGVLNDEGFPARSGLCTYLVEVGPILDDRDFRRWHLASSKHDIAHVASENDDRICRTIEPAASGGQNSPRK